MFKVLLLITGLLQQDLVYVCVFERTRKRVPTFSPTLSIYMRESEQYRDRMDVRDEERKR